MPSTTCPKCGNKLSRKSIRCKKCNSNVNQDVSFQSKEQQQWLRFKEKTLSSLGVLVFIAGLIAASVLFHYYFPSRSADSAEAPGDSILQRAGGAKNPDDGADAEFLLVTPEYSRRYWKVSLACKSYADKHCGKIANLLIWADPKMVPQKYPLSEEQLENQVGKYIRNVDAKVDSFYVFNKGASRLLESSDEFDDEASERKDRVR